MNIPFIILMLTAYLVGSIPNGYLLGKCFGKDIRKQGSGNIGATNTLRSLGKAAGVLTLLLDALKGALPVVIFPMLLSGDHLPVSIYQNAGIFFGFAAFCGHNWTIFLKFKGGKGVATALGIFMVLSWKAMIIAVILAVILIAITRYVSLGSLSGGYIFVLTNHLISQQWTLTGVAILIMVIITLRHKANIQRLLQGNENKI